MKPLVWRTLKIAGRLYALAVVGYVVLLILSFGTMFAQPRAIRLAGNIVEAVVFFPQQFLPPPGRISNEVHWLVCAVWMFAVVCVPALAYAALTSRRTRPVQEKP